MPGKKPHIENACAAFRLAPRQGELAPLLDLWVESWQATLPQIDFAARRDWFRIHLEAIERQGGLTVCAYDRDGRLSGFLLLDPRRRRLEQIAVAPAYFGRGLGGQLLDHAKRLCPKGLSLAVNCDNPRALRFYEKHGFCRGREGTNPRSGLKIWQMRWTASRTPG